MVIKFKRKWAYPLFFAKVPVYINGEEVAKIKNKGEYIYEGHAPQTIKLHGPGVVRSLEFALEEYHEEIEIEFKIAMGFATGGFSVKIYSKGEEVQKIRKTY